MLSRVFLMATSILVIFSLYLSPSFKTENSLVAGIPAFADHGEEITLTLHNSSFGSLTSGSGNQVSVFAQYALNDNSIAGQTLNAVMEVYAPNGTLIRTSSFPDGFVAQGSGGIEGLETTIRDRTLQSVTANVTFRDLTKSEILSNDLLVDLTLAQEGGGPTAPGESGTPTAPGESGTPTAPGESGTPTAPGESGTPTTPGESTGTEEEGLFGAIPSQQIGPEENGEATEGEGGDEDEDESQQGEDIPSVPLG
jgi:hypothetical protein